MVDPSVDGLRQSDHALAQRVSQPPYGSATPIAKDQGRWAAGPIRRTQTADLAGGASEQPRGLGHRELRPFESIEDEQLLLRMLRQGDHASPIRLAAGRTFSLANHS